MNIAEEIGVPALLGQTAEECAELAHACLKLQRIMMGTNPTPVKRDAAEKALLEESMDLETCLVCLESEASIKTTDYQLGFKKRQRWEERINDLKGGEEKELSSI